MTQMRSKKCCRPKVTNSSEIIEGQRDHAKLEGQNRLSKEIVIAAHLEKYTRPLERENFPMAL